MIVKMSRVFVVSRGDDRGRLLEVLGELGVVHLEPVAPSQAVAAEDTLTALDRTGRAVQILSAVEPGGDAPEMSTEQAVEQTLQIQRESAELKSRLVALHHQLAQLAIWGDVQLEQFARLRDAGVEPAFFSVPKEVAAEFQAELVHVIGVLPGKRLLVAIVDRDGSLEPPAQARPLELPPRDRPSIRQEAADIDGTLKQHAERLAAMAKLIPALETRRAELQRQVNFSIATGGGLSRKDLFAIQGWAPTEKLDSLSAGLARAGLAAAVQGGSPEPDEQPPTLIRYPRWARPIQGLFDILGTLPGYKEYDLSPFFMVALPVFAAMLIGDAGYGLIFLLLPLLLYRRLVAKAGKVKIHLLMVFGAATLIWGVLTANYFGITPETMAAAGGYMKIAKNQPVPDIDAMLAGSGLYASVGRVMAAAAPVWDAEPETARNMLIRISFVIGALHLIIAHLKKAFELAPDLRFVAELGWCVVIAAMLVLIWHLFFIGVEVIPAHLWLVLAAGLALPIAFGHPSRNLAKRIFGGFAASLLPLLGTFSDTMSYIRLMAVGLASYYIASAFNGLGVMLADAITWYAVLPVLVIVFGHLLNIGLAMIAIFAHGVRLNMLEFSNNAGVQWAGYPYEPFAEQQIKEN
ncbi:MAG: hypothetical protein SVT52_02580 [Planctomycetota bacterium]|nr:hypothetical protein [Planctomycetota bacterium]